MKQGNLKATFILLFFSAFAQSFCQEISLDSLACFIAKHYYTQIDDKKSLLSTNIENRHFGLYSLVNFVEKEKVCTNMQHALESDYACTRLSLFHQSNMNYCNGIELAKNIEYLNISSVFTGHEVPWGVYNLTNLKVLVIDISSIHVLSPRIGNLQRLEYLSIAQGRIGAIPKEIANLSNLVGLDLSHHDIEILPTALSGLKRLKYLSIEGNPIRYSIDKALTGLDSLEFLSITLSKDYRSFEETVKVLTKLPNLRVLHLRDSDIPQLPEIFSEFPRLEQLSLRGNYNLDLSQVLEVIGKIDSLKILDLSFSRIDKIPEEIGCLQNVESLYLGNWEWCCPFISFGGLKPPHNNISKLPKSVSKMISLENLYLWSSGISEKEKVRITELLPNTNIEFDMKYFGSDLEPTE